MKTQVDTIDAVPSKRLFLSIIADYDLKRAICELIDNGLDIWVRNSKSAPIDVKIIVDKNQQTITITDNAGGVKKENLRFIVSPGGTTNSPNDEVIGIFGVGTKRAVIALAQEVRITTRYKKEKTYSIEFNDDWLKIAEDWILPLYETNPVADGTTTIELSKLRIIMTDEIISQLREHLEAIYSEFLTNNGVLITLNGVQLKPKFFANWAYPPKYEPRKYMTKIINEEQKEVRVEIKAGLAIGV